MPVDKNEGFGISLIQEDTIATAQLGAIKDLGRNYGYAVVRILDCANIAAGSALQLKSGITTTDTMCFIYDNTNGIDLIALPSSGTFQAVFAVAMGIRRIQANLSIASTGDVDIEFYGYDPLR